MSKITEIKSREILDSRGNPTVECDITIDNEFFGRSSVPSGASTGRYEAVELRDGDLKRHNGKGVRKAIENINKVIKSQVLNKEFNSIRDFDSELIKIDGTDNKSKLGANAILATSLSFAKCISAKSSLPLFYEISKNKKFSIPVPMINIINGGAHADNNVDIQEFMIAPLGAKNFQEALQYGCEVFHSLKSILKSKNLNTNVGDEGGFAPDINNSRDVIETIIQSIESVGLNTEKDIKISLDVASTEFYKNGIYNLKGEKSQLNSNQMLDYLKKLVEDYPIFSIEDGMAEDDWEGWIDLTKELGKKIQLVGDDLFVTNLKRLKKGIEKNAANSILIKLNQIGTLTETLDAIYFAKDNQYNTIISHRSGETEDTFISDLSVSVSAGQIKTGSLSRTDRTAKYNQIIRIEEYLGIEARYEGNNIIKH